MRNYLRKISALVLIGISIISCSSNPEPPILTLPPPETTVCSTTNTPLQQMLTALKAAGNIEGTNYDLQVHEFAFKMSVAGKICSIGYQSHPVLANAAVYKMEILDNNGVIYTGNLAFSATQISYVSIPPVNINANQTYVIRRTTLPQVNLVSNRMGSVVLTPTTTFPYTNGNTTITACDGFYDVGGTRGNILKGIPRIDFAFTPN